MNRVSKSEQAEAIARLREWIKPGDTVYTILRSVSRSGMSRTLDIFIIHAETPRPLANITWHVAEALNLSRERNTGAIKMGGCGYDAGFDVVYSLGRKLFADGFTCIGEHCPSNDHTNGDRDYTPHPHTDPGYALRHEWI